MCLVEKSNKNYCLERRTANQVSSKIRYRKSLFSYCFEVLTSNLFWVIVAHYFVNIRGVLRSKKVVLNLSLKNPDFDGTSSKNPSSSAKTFKPLPKTSCFPYFGEANFSRFHPNITPILSSTL